MAISEDNTRVLITISKEFKAELVQEAKKENRSLSNYIVHILQNRKKGR